MNCRHSSEDRDHSVAVLLCAVCKLAGDRERLLALFSYTSTATSDIISEFADTFQLPVVSVAPAIDQSLRRRIRRHLGNQRPPAGELDHTETMQDELTFAFYVRPLYTGAVIDIIQHYKWQHVFYVFDDADGRHHV